MLGLTPGGPKDPFMESWPFLGGLSGSLTSTVNLCCGVRSKRDHLIVNNWVQQRDHSILNDDMTCDAALRQNSSENLCSKVFLNTDSDGDNVMMALVSSDVET